MALDFGTNAATLPSAPGASSSSPVVAPDKTPASPPVMAPGPAPLAWLALALALGWIFTRGG